MLAYSLAKSIEFIASYFQSVIGVKVQPHQSMGAYVKLYFRPIFDSLNA